MSTEITYKDARTFAASFVSGIRNSLLTSLVQQADETEESSSNGVITVAKTPPANYYPPQPATYNNTPGSRYNKEGSCNVDRNVMRSQDSSRTNFLELNKKTPNENELFTFGVCPLSSSASELPANKFQIFRDDVVKEIQVEEKQDDNNMIKYGKKCPKCYAINEKDANWCMECGKAIISVEIRRCDSFQENKHMSNLSFHRSESHPAATNYNASLVNSFNNLHLQLGLQPDEGVKKTHLDLNNVPSYNSMFYDFQANSPTFEEYPSKHDKNMDRNTAIYRRAVNDEKTPELPYLYAFDDLLYPNYAMDDPVMGYVLPSSNIVSHSRTPFFTPVHHNKISNLPDNKYNERPCSASNKKHRRSRKKKEKVPLMPVSVPIEEKERQITEIHHIEEKERIIDHSNNHSLQSNLNLPEEVILHIFSFLTIPRLATCARVCRQFYRISSDESLWKSITLRKKHTINDDVLHKIAKKHPSSLTISQCNAKNITIEGLRHLFRACSESLKVLDVSGSSGGVFVGESVLLHVSSRCHNIISLDVSWSNVANEGVQSICHASKRLVRLSLNGCQGITDESIKSITEMHCDSLEVLELFGCFNITPTSINIIAAKCKELRVLNLGQCHKVTNQALCSIARGLTKIESLDIRGCKQVRDSSLKEIITNYRLLSTLVIANCPSVTDSTLNNLASCLPQLRCLDVCGVGKISDRGVQALAKSCHILKSLDLSSTKATCRSVIAISLNCRQALESLKLSFCHSITDACLHAVVTSCKK